MTAFKLGSRVRLDDLDAVAVGGCRVLLTPAVKRRLARARRAVEVVLEKGEKIYGVTTGFGELASIRISKDKIRRLNLNYIRSHSCGVGRPLCDEDSRGVVFLRANELARGFAACRPVVVDAMAKLLNRGVVPVVPSQGSVGASGDLAPLAHVALALIGEGEARRGGRLLKGKAVLRAAGLRPLVPEAKEALSLTNGTQAMQAVGGIALLKARRLLSAAECAGAVSVEAIKGSHAPFDARLVRLKPHPGQLKTAANLRRLLDDSEIMESHRHECERVQDPYSFRCIPQIHGAARDAIESAAGVVEREMNSVTDNPPLCGSEFLSGGNFHGMAIAMALDQAALGLTVLGGVSERRIFHMTSGKEPGLSLFLADEPGLESGMMIPQYVAAALVSENKTLAHPASADSVPTSANKEDFVSMGMWGAIKLQSIVQNTARILAIEFIAGSRGVALQAPLKPARRVGRLLSRLARFVPAVRGDRALSKTIESLAERLLREGLGEEG